METRHNKDNFSEYSSDDTTSDSESNTDTTSNSESNTSECTPRRSISPFPEIHLTQTRVQQFPQSPIIPEEHHDVEVVAVVAPDAETLRQHQLEEAKQRIQKQTKIRDACELTLYRLYKKTFPYIGPRREGESDEDYEARINDLQVQKQLIKPVMSRYLDAEKIIWQSYRRCFELQAKHQ